MVLYFVLFVKSCIDFELNLRYKPTSMGDPRERAVLTPLSDRTTLNPLIPAGPQDWQSDQFRNQVQAYINEAPEQPFFNRTDIMRATGRADNYTSPGIQATILDMHQKFGGYKGNGAKISHIRLTREGFVEACRLIGPRDNSRADNGRRGAMVKYHEGQDVVLQPQRRWGTYGRKKGVVFSVEPRPKREPSTNTPKKPTQEELASQVDRFIAENRLVFYSMADVTRATGRRPGATRTLRRIIRGMLTENGITTLRNPKIPEGIFRAACLTVGAPDPRISEARKRYWEEKGLKPKVQLDHSVIRELRRRGQRPTEQQIQMHTRVVSATLDGLLRGRDDVLPRDFISNLVRFFGGKPGGYYFLSDIFVSTGRSAGGNPDLRQRAVEILEENGIRREWKTGPLPVPLQLALSICLEMGPRHDPKVRTKPPVDPRPKIPHEPKGVANPPQEKDKITKETQIFPKPQVDEFKEEGPFTLDIHKTFGLAAILRATLNQAILGKYEVVISNELMRKINAVAEPIAQDRRKMGNRAPDLELEVLPEVFQYLLSFAEGNREVFFRENPPDRRLLLQPFAQLSPERLTAMIHDLYNQYMS